VGKNILKVRKIMLALFSDFEHVFQLVAVFVLKYWASLCKSRLTYGSRGVPIAISVKNKIEVSKFLSKKKRATASSTYTSSLLSLSMNTRNTRRNTQADWLSLDGPEGGPDKREGSSRLAFTPDKMDPIRWTR